MAEVGSLIKRLKLGQAVRIGEVRVLYFEGSPSLHQVTLLIQADKDIPIVEEKYHPRGHHDRRR